MSDNNTLQQERRAARRKRRIINQTLAYLTVILFAAAIVAGAYFGIKFVSKLSEEKRAEKQEKQSMVEEILNSEEEIVYPESEEESEEPIVEKTYEEKLDEIANACIEVMPIEDRVAGLFFVSPEAITGVSVAVKAGDGTKEALAQHAVGGILYKKQNMVDEAQFTEMVDNTRLYSKYPLFLASTEEGGSNSSIVAAGLEQGTDGAAKIGEAGDVSLAYDAGTTIATYMAKYNLNLNFGPVADLKVADNGIYNKQVYGSEAASVAPYVNAMQSALKSQGITACVKHFPGMGSLTVNPGDGVAVSERSLEEFQNTEFALFKDVIDGGADMIMISNGSATALTGDNTPCSMSKEAISYLRDTLGYNGVIITEAMDEKAISEYHSADEAAILALKAGCDMILMPEDFTVAYEGVLKAVKEGTISEERINDSLRRIYRIKYADKIEKTEETVEETVEEIVEEGN